MKSRWCELKPDATKLRKNGFSIGKIERRLGIPRSTLSGWLKNIKLSQEQKEKLLQDWKNALVKARKKAVLWHNAQKKKRLEEAKREALKTLEKINVNDLSVIELSLAMLYLGEGAKTTDQTALGSSDPLILRFFLAIVRGVYNLDIGKIRCELNLRADQDPEEMKRFWAKTLKLPLANFKYVNSDQRTIGSKTYPDYKGVCHIKCGNVAIQRKLIHISNLFCKKIIKNNLGTWRSG
jgi:hypothetical protein